MKRIFITILDVIIALLIIFIAVISYLNIRASKKPDNLPYIGNYCVLNVLSNSMSPGIMAGDMIIIKRTPEEAIKKGDIITFMVKDEKGKPLLVTHRIQDITTSAGVKTFITKGDANNTSDEGTVKYSRIAGKYILKLHIIGKLSQFLKKPLGFILLIILPILLLLGSELRGLLKERQNGQKVPKEEKKDEENADQ